MKSNKITSYINESSNVKQNINGITKTLQERHIIINSEYNNYKQMKKEIFSTLITNNEWTPYDLRKVEHLKYNRRGEMLNKYSIKKKMKYNEYINMNKLTLHDKNWWSINQDNKRKENNFYITYQKTLIDEKEINKIITECEKELPQEIMNEYKINLFYRYQSPLKAYLNKR